VWHTETVTALPIFDLYVSLALGDDGTPNISYYDSNNMTLMFAYRTSGGWQFQTVDNNGNVGSYNSLAIDSNGYPHISYFDSTNLHLKYANQDVGGWHIETIDSASVGGTFTSLELDGNDQPHISYYNFINSELKYAYWAGGQWLIETVDTLGEVTYAHNDLELDSNGIPHLSYVAVYNEYYYDGLMYAVRDVGGWSLEPVDQIGDVGRFNSLELGALGHPLISYFDYSDYELLFASAGVFTPVAPEVVAITGAETGMVDNPYTFIAEVQPISTTLPVQFVWQATGQQPFTHTGGLSDDVVFAWDTAGSKVIIVTASNDLGIVTDTHNIMISEQPIEGLLAVNDSPTTWGEPTVLTATVEQGSNVVFEWDFGDGEIGVGQVASHVFPAVGEYTAIVTASNSVGYETTTNTVIITDIPINGLASVNDSPMQLGITTTLTATVESGSNVVYAWNFGDGSTGEGNIAAHVYTEAGIYTATVTASNGVGSLSTETIVTIFELQRNYQIVLPLVVKDYASGTGVAQSVDSPKTFWYNPALPMALYPSPGHKF
jgi:PKD repeat protein